MIRTRSRVRKTIAQLAIATVTFASLGAAVVAAPFDLSDSQNLAGCAFFSRSPAARRIQLAKAGPGDASEDCVRVTRMTGPDGKEYPTNGMVCGGE